MRLMKKLLFFSCLALLSVTIYSCKPQNNFAKPTVVIMKPLVDTLNVGTAKRLVKNFEGRTQPLKKGELIFDDTRCVWFNIKQLRSLVDRIEAEKGDGIRFYLAAYDKVIKSDIKTSPQFRDYSTIVMVSTRDSLGLHYDYYYDQKHKGKKGGIITATPENQGELCPPPAHCNTIGATLLP